MVLANFDWRWAVTVVFMRRFTVKKSSRGCCENYNFITRFSDFVCLVVVCPCCNVSFIWRLHERECEEMVKVECILLDPFGAGICYQKA